MQTQSAEHHHLSRSFVKRFIATAVKFNPRPETSNQQEISRFNLIINSISDNDLLACVVFMEIRTGIVAWRRQRECIDVSGIYLGAVFTSTTSALWVFLIGTRKKSQFHFMRAFSTLMTRRRRRCRVHKWKEESKASCATCARDENEKSNRTDTRLVFWRLAMVWGFFEWQPNMSRK